MGKGEFRDLARTMDAWRSGYGSEFRPKFGEQRQDMYNFNWNQLRPYETSIGQWADSERPDLNTVQQNYRDIVNDPSKRGFGADTLNMMYGKQAEVGSAALRNAQANSRRQIAAQGMSNTGAGIRQNRLMNADYQNQQRAARRDIDIQNAMQGRNEYFGGLQGLMGTQAYQDELKKNAFQLQGNALGMQQNLFDQQLRNLMGENDVYRTAFNSFAPETDMYREANQPGFWGKVGNAFAGAFGGSLGRIAGGGNMTMG